MRRLQQTLLDISNGECQECGMIGPLFVHGKFRLCECCESEFEED